MTLEIGRHCTFPQPFANSSSKSDEIVVVIGGVVHLTLPPEYETLRPSISRPSTGRPNIALRVVAERPIRELPIAVSVLSGRSTSPAALMRHGRRSPVHVVEVNDLLDSALGCGLALAENPILERGAEAAVAVVNEDRRGPRQHIVRVRAGRSSSAFLLVGEFRPVRGCAWKCPVVRPCCRRRCRQTATYVRAVEWGLAGVLPGLGSGMVRGPYAGPATRAGRDPARNLNEWPPGLARRGPWPGEVGKAQGHEVMG